ncbi:MAG: hypothetical protein H5U32_21285 [Pseudomonas balearica]|uniref:hypothetical protein n=1 Tax=Stutzerimonas balearica TaxID=74829 RepID=UPI0019994F39|nr:hypothetical protein [Stutzerimonas balearica]MBC7201742.1 hypothetical protein [Stutzerimonas balearica]
MRKTLTTLALATSLFSGASFAAGTAITTGDRITNAECELLGENVTLTLSNNVHGAYSCAKENNSISVATCHFAGSRKVGTERCVVIGQKDDKPVYNDESCTGATPEDTFEVNNKGKAFLGSSTGGSIGASSLAGFCSDETVAATIGEE